jgi:hypothetical protein
LACCKREERKRKQPFPLDETTNGESCRASGSFFLQMSREMMKNLQKRTNVLNNNWRKMTEKGRKLL